MDVVCVCPVFSHSAKGLDIMSPQDTRRHLLNSMSEHGTSENKANQSGSVKTRH